MTLAPDTASAGRLRRAGPEDAGALARLALISKAAWGYDAAFMAACRAELTVRQESISRDPTYLVEAEGRILGFYQLGLDDAVAEIRMMFVAPGALRSGLGRRLWAHLEETARTAGVRRLEVDSDPHAEAFYRAMGMRRVGEAPSGSIPGRMLPHLAKELAPRGQEMRRGMSSGGS